MKNEKTLLLLLVFISCILINSAKSQSNVTNIQIKQGFCNSEVIFDFSSIDKILNSPNEILDNVNLFWESDSAYVLAKVWHETTQVPIPMKKRTKSIKKILKLSDDNRQSYPTMQLANKLKEKEQDFINNAILQIASFLPEQTPKLSTKIYFTAFTTLWAFSAYGHSVISLTDSHYHNSAEYVLNLMIHELFHVGYAHNINLRKEEKLNVI